MDNQMFQPLGVGPLLDLAQDVAVSVSVHAGCSEGVAEALGQALADLWAPTDDATSPADVIRLAEAISAPVMAYKAETGHPHVQLDRDDLKVLCSRVCGDLPRRQRDRTIRLACGLAGFTLFQSAKPGDQRVRCTDAPRAIRTGHWPVVRLIADEPTE